MKKPNYVKGQRSIKLHLHSVMDILHDIHEQGHAAQFKDAAAKAGAFLSVQPKTANFVKQYIADNKLHAESDIAEKVVTGCPPGADPYKCPYSVDG